ncbi:hypothetical protein BC826DRAFT_687771 [Russula brevipes]|nr:hypothetical protein BC826DRAFT_687771 [Russula brevipes]
MSSLAVCAMFSWSLDVARVVSEKTERCARSSHFQWLIQSSWAREYRVTYRLNQFKFLLRTHPLRDPYKGISLFKQTRDGGN